MVLCKHQMDSSSLSTIIFSQCRMQYGEKAIRRSQLCATQMLSKSLNFQWFVYGKQAFLKNQIRSSQFYCNDNIFTDINTKLFGRRACAPLIKCKVIIAFKVFNTLLYMSLEKVAYFYSY